MDKGRRADLILQEMQRLQSRAIELMIEAKELIEQVNQLAAMLSRVDHTIVDVKR